MVEHDLDRDDAVKHYPTGPGRRQPSRGPVIEVYADGAIDRPCTGCGAHPQKFCRHPGGALRRLPCPERLSEQAPA